MQQEKEIPGYLMDWIEGYDYNQLNDVQREKVLEIIPESEYNKIRTTFRMMKESIGIEVFPRVGDFNSVETKSFSIKSLADIQLPFLKVAAVFVITVIGAFMFGYLLHPTSGTGNNPENPGIREQPSAGTESGIANSGDKLAQGFQLQSRSLKEDSLAAIFITGIYK